MGFVLRRTRAILVTRSILRGMATPSSSLATVFSAMDSTVYKPVVLGNSLQLFSVTISSIFSLYSVSGSVVPLSSLFTPRRGRSMFTWSQAALLPEIRRIYRNLSCAFLALRLSCAGSFPWHSRPDGQRHACTVQGSGVYPVRGYQVGLTFRVG